MLRSMEVIRGTAGADASAGAIGGTLVLRTVTADDLIPTVKLRAAKLACASARCWQNLQSMLPGQHN
jgi:outer membrane receptor protein involved in Fe transport